VPAEPQVVELVRTRHVRPNGVTTELFTSSHGADGSTKWTVARNQRGDCVFFAREGGRLCAIHRDLGADALPVACRHFPRKVVIDARGTLISLSHFCPTAAATLLTAASLAIVEAHPPLRLSAPIDGLDATDTLPPLLRPGLLCDMEGYDAWERAGISLLAESDRGFENCLDVLAGATDSIRRWNPGDGTLAQRVRRDVQAAAAARVALDWSATRTIERVRLLTIGRVGNDLIPLNAFDATWNDHAGKRLDWFNSAMKNYLASRLFANWIAYQGRGLRTIVEWLRTCVAVVAHELLRRTDNSIAAPDPADFIEAVRSADLLLLHVLDSASFARKVATIEAP
jgi:hypothetical protein